MIILWKRMRLEKKFSLIAFIRVFIAISMTSFNIKPANTITSKTIFEINNSTSKQYELNFNMPHYEAIIANQLYDSDDMITNSQIINLENVTDGFCTLRIVSKSNSNQEQEQNNNNNNNNNNNYNREKVSQVSERAVNCSRLNENNYLKLVENLYKRNKLSIQQIHITDSESFVVFSAIDLICNRFDCSKLTTLNVSGQRVHDSNELSKWINRWSELEMLDLSNTSLMSIESIFQTKSNIILQNLTHLNIDFNQITILNFDFILIRMPKLKYLSLVNNTITDINCNESFRLRVKTQFEQISMAGNAINCDKSQLWLMKQFQTTVANIKFPDFDKINCSAPERLSDMTWPQRVSVLETQICDKCDCRSLKRAAISVDCHNKSLIALPDVLPLNTKVLNLTSNRINSLGLPLNSKNWENVTYVYLENNLITSFQPLDINSKFMRNLAALDIRKNRFQEFPSHIFEQFINLDQVHLSNNPWLCDCDTTFAFQEWLQRQFHKVGDKEEILCGISGSDENGVRSINLKQRLSARVIYRLSKSELCPQNNEEEPYDWLDFVNITLAITIIMILSKVTIDYIYQHRTKRLPHFFKLNY